MSTKGKIRDSAVAALADVARDGMTVAVGGFGLTGVPFDLVEALRDTGVRDLTIVSNNMGTDGNGLGLLLENHQVSHVICSYAGENALFARQYLDGEVTIEFNPQGTLAERLRAGGAGIAGFYTRTGVGTVIEDDREAREFDGQRYLLERGIRTDLALVRAHQADEAGNLVYRLAARNFNPVVALAGDVTIAEAEQIVPTGTLDPEHIITPGVAVHRLVVATERDKPIEQRTVRPAQPVPVA
ncbi:CoA transferase subunit A [Pseudoclavibacter soli]|uniref:CoA transferase subunit A n=1 Tax=Pseudoclavibacter soli TaxID=452623 RepID=UPI0003F8D9B5|nr:CoA transferase subunit A [Pseudoclavibacter soli]